jgi:hypothetical protein
MPVDLKSVNKSVFVMTVLCVFSLTGTKCLNILNVKFLLERVNMLQLKTGNRIDLSLSRREQYGSTSLR